MNVLIWKCFFSFSLKHEFEGFVAMPTCLYTTVCRQPVIDDEDKEQVFILPASAQFEISVSLVLVVSEDFFSLFLETKLQLHYS